MTEEVGLGFLVTSGPEKGLRLYILLFELSVKDSYLFAVFTCLLRLMLGTPLGYLPPFQICNLRLAPSKDQRRRLTYQRFNALRAIILQ
jgi:hypothetical protein